MNSGHSCPDTPRKKLKEGKKSDKYLDFSIEVQKL